MSAGQGKEPRTGLVRGPMARRLLLGTELRRLRVLSGVTREDAGYLIRGSASKISRMELGRAAVKERDVADLLALYGVAENEREPLLRLAREAAERASWRRYGDMVPSWRHRYLDLEEDADHIRTYTCGGIPEALLTEEYARACLHSGSRQAGASEIDERLYVRLMHRRFHRAAHRTFTAVVDEAALLRLTGDRHIVRGQLERLAGANETAGSELRVIPLGRPSAPIVHQPFTMLRFEKAEIPDVVYIEFLTTALYLSRAVETAAYYNTWDRLRAASLSPEDSRALVVDLLKRR
ncbi:helix-turn-helix domain-containing protein [Actinomadura sp. NAK00032]|uniref:helix-turn-helix domain-containing protein n=1 Tax=Actinomadura sp. NAK00032 TaxID=2742128 RepID=UPI0015922707|nr:helix-turn-helix transcriptional regulator [Actinomadura sp. NAK00032]QKW39978.1 helix-turn-helix domain-containing protein [Actinomadura sp. NAK00032]